MSQRHNMIHGSNNDSGFRSGGRFPFPPQYPDVPALSSMRRLNLLVTMPESLVTEPELLVTMPESPVTITGMGSGS